MASALNLLKLTDHYERKARLLPALLSCLVVVPVGAALSSSTFGWFYSLSLGGGIAVVGAVALAYTASAAGRHFERKLWPDWPHDAPTNRWLHPDDTHCSQEQKKLWYEAVKEVVGLDIGQAVTREDQENLERIINDAVRALRHQFRITELDGLLSTHNEDYGFARNLAGLRVFWLPASVMSTAGVWLVYFTMDTAFTWAVIGSIAQFICLCMLFILPKYVRQRADRYAESFFGTLTSVSRASR